MPHARRASFRVRKSPTSTGCSSTWLTPSNQASRHKDGAGPLLKHAATSVRGGPGAALLVPAFLRCPLGSLLSNPELTHLIEGIIKGTSSEVHPVGKEASMPKSIKAVLLSLSALLVIFIIAGGLGVRAANNEGAYRQLGVYSEVLSRVRSEYVEEPNVSQVTDGALHGLLEALDANSSYLNPTEYKQFKERRSEGKAATGASISKRFGYGAVLSVMPNSPAAKAGVEAGDIIEAIDGRSTREMSLAELRSLLNGQQGSNVSLTIVRARKAEPMKVTVTRDAIVIPPVSERMMEDGIGYIKA